MSDGTSPLDLAATGQLNAEVTFNELANAMSPAALFARRKRTSAGLIWGYYGGRMNGDVVANGTLTLTAEDDNYIVVHRTTLVVSVATTTTNWDDTSTYGRAYIVPTGAATVTEADIEDHRFGEGGILTPSGSAPSGSAGGDLSGTYPNPTVTTDAISNTKLANMATATFKGRTTAGTGDPEDLSATQATALLNNMVGDSGSGGTKGLAPAPSSGDAAAGKFLKADATWAVPPGSGGSGDIVGTLVNSEISVTGATTATISTMHVCSGTSADYTLTLPAVSGNTGKMIGIRMSYALTRVVTIDGNSSETIDSGLTKVMFKGESCILLCDGSGWVTVADRKINATCILNRNSAQSIPNDTATKVNVNNQVVDTTARMGDTSGSVITIRRNGRYQVQASWGLVSIFDDTERIISYVRQNGSGVAIFAALSPAAAQTLTATAGGVFDCTAGDTFEIAVEQNTGASQNTSTTAQYLPTLVVTEIPTGG